jgi:hypothetical protein
MDQDVGSDAAWKETAISVRQNRKRVWRGKGLSDPKRVAERIRKHAPYAVWVVFESGPLANWFHRKLTAGGLPAVGIDARHAKAALDTAPNKTDANEGCLLGLGRDRPEGSRQKPGGDAGGAITISDCKGAGPDRRARAARRHLDRALES